MRPRVGQKEPPRLGSTSCYGQTWARKSRQDSAVRFVTAKNWPERATETRQYDLLLPNVGQIVTAKSWPERATKTRQYDLLRTRIGQKKPPRLGSTISYGQTWARKSHQDSAVRFVTAKSWPEKATKTLQYDLLRPRLGQKEPPRLGSTICCGQTWARKSHEDSAVLFVTAKRGPERAIKTRQYAMLRTNVCQKKPPKTRQYDLLQPRVGQKEPSRLGSTICYGQTWARKSHQDSAVRFVTAKNWPERATKTGQYDFLRPNVGQKEPPRLDSTICYGQTWARKRHEDSAVRFVTAKSWPERATKTRQYDLLQPRGGQKEPPRLGSTICCGQTWARKSHQDSAVRFVTAKRGICYGQKLARKNHQDSAVRFSTANRKSHRDPAVRFVAAKRGPERATKTRQYDLLRPRVGQKEPPRLGSTICYGKTWARKSHQDSAVRFITAKRGPERATETRQYDLLRPNVGQKEPPRLDSTICYGQTWARKRHEDSAL